MSSTGCEEVVKNKGQRNIAAVSTHVQRLGTKTEASLEGSGEQKQPRAFGYLFEHMKHQE